MFVFVKKIYFLLVKKSDTIMQFVATIPQIVDSKDYFYLNNFEVSTVVKFVLK